METEIIKINPKEIKLLELNARYMDNEEYSKLVTNIKRDGKLTSIPFCCYESNGQIKVLSGNHRIMAAIDAGLQEVEIMICKTQLSEDQKIAIQLSHNSIVGKDDNDILKQLFSEIESFDFKEYSGLTDEFIEFCKTNEESLNTPSLQYQIINLMFLPSEIKELKEFFRKSEELVSKNEFLVASMKDYDAYSNLVTDISKALCIKNPATVFLSIIELAQRHIDELKNIWIEKSKDTDYIPVSTIIGRSDLKKEYAIKFDKAVQLLLDKKIIKKNERDKALAVLSDYYLIKDKKFLD